MTPDSPIHPESNLPDPQDVQSLVEALGGLYGAPVPVPPEVDQAVMARARLRLGSPRRGLRRWLIPIGAAACLALAIGLTSWDRTPHQSGNSGGLAHSSLSQQASPSPSRSTFREWPGLTGASAAPGTPAPSAVALDRTSEVAAADEVKGAVARSGRRVGLREDFDRNGRVDILDAFGLARGLEGTAAPGPEWDLDGNGIVDRRDVDLMAMAAVRLVETPR